jgi:hypothetical protein
MLPGRRARAGAGGKDANLGRQHYVLPLLKIVPPLLDAIFPVFAAPATPVGVLPQGPLRTTVHCGAEHFSALSSREWDGSPRPPERPCFRCRIAQLAVDRKTKVALADMRAAVIPMNGNLQRAHRSWS